MMWLAAPSGQDPPGGGEARLAAQMHTELTLSLLGLYIKTLVLEWFHFSHYKCRT